MPDDFIMSNHRGHGHFIARTKDINGLFAEIMGKTTGVSKGMGGSQHLLAHRYLSNGIQGGMTPIAAGVGLAYQMDDSRNIAIVFIGDGTLGQGVLYETLNICGLWGLPVLFILENNGYAQSTSIKNSFSGDLKKRIEGFGVEYLNTDTWDLDGLNDRITLAVDLVREKQRSCFLEIKTYRLKSHSKGDDNRENEEIEYYVKKDILSKIIQANNEKTNLFLSQIEEQIEAAIGFASASPTLDYCDIPSVKRKTTVYKNNVLIKKNRRVNDLIYDALVENFTKDDRTIMIGEDIEFSTELTPKPYGGAFKVSKDLGQRFQGRVKNTPISEAAIMGIGTGLALVGKKPIVEIMFGDFLLLTFDQLINHASKFCTMFGEEISIPLIIRTPMGGGRGYGPTHSQTLEKHLLGIPNLSIVALNYRVDPKVIYSSLLKNSKVPTLVIENKVLYTRKLNYNEMLGFRLQLTDEELPTLRIMPENDITPDMTIFCYGGLLEQVEEAIKLSFDEEEISCEVICPSLISPINIEPLLASVLKTKKLLIVEEGSSTASLGSEVVSLIIERQVYLKQLKRIGVNTIIPCSTIAENNLLPNKNNLFSSIRDLHNEH